jgi:enoyl-CoA hydratase/carnithine racemase
MEDLVLVEPTSWGVRLVLNRPDKLNAISAELREALVTALDDAIADERVRVIAIAGAGRAFCSGYDLSEAAPASAWDWRDVLARDVEATLAVWRCPKPVIAQVHGYALAGGLELAMACDLIVAAEGSQLGEPEIRFGSAPVTLLMPFLIGQKKTRELLLTGDLVPAAEAERIGLVNRVVPADRLGAEVDALADRLARVPPDVMAPTKLMLNRAMDAAGFAAAVELGLDLQSFVNMSETAREFDAIVRRDGLKAALGWRDARYDERLGGRSGASAAGRTKVRPALVPWSRSRLRPTTGSLRPERRHPFGHREAPRPNRPRSRGDCQREQRSRTHVCRTAAHGKGTHRDGGYPGGHDAGRATAEPPARDRRTARGRLSAHDRRRLDLARPVHRQHDVDVVVHGRDDRRQHESDRLHLDRRDDAGRQRHPGAHRDERRDG